MLVRALNVTFQNCILASGDNDGKFNANQNKTKQSVKFKFLRRK